MPRKSVPRITAVIKVTLLLELPPPDRSATLGYASSIFDMYYNRVFSKALAEDAAPLSRGSNTGGRSSF